MSMVITPQAQAFIDKWDVLFADNEFENITEKTYRDFAADVAVLHEQGQSRQVQLTASANSAESLIAGKDVQPGRLYAIKGTPDPTDPKGLSGTWNGTGDEQTVYVVGLAPALFAAVGCLLNTTTDTTTPVQVDVQAGQYQALQGAAPIWHYVGDPTEQSIAIGELDLTRNSFDTSGLNEGNLFYSGPTVEDNTVGAAFSFNKVGLDFRRNQLGENCFDNDFQFSFTDNVLGDNVNACYFDAGTQFLELGTGCERLSFYNCKGTPQQRFVVPAGTVDAIFRNNQLVNKADEDGRFDLLTPTESAVHGLLDLRYTYIGATGTWELKPGKTIELKFGCNFRFAPDVVEGDLFGVYINPTSTRSRLVLSTVAPGGIDEQPNKRYTKATLLVYRYTLFASYVDANNNTIPARYGLQTVQQTPPNAVTNRGAFALDTYYLVGDLVERNNVLYLRQVEGSDTGAFDPSKWAGGGGGGTAAPDGTLPLTLMRNADYTLALDDVGCLVPVNSASAVVITVPSHADVAIPVGATLYVAQDGAGAVSIAPAPGVVLRTADGYKVGGQWLDVALHKRNLNTWVLKGGVS